MALRCVWNECGVAYLCKFLLVSRLRDFVLRNS